MKIVCIVSPYYDYLTATIIEGLQDLGHQIIASENSNYAHKTSDRILKKAAEDADLIIIFSNSKVRVGLLKGIVNERIVYVDGSDTFELVVPQNLKLKAIFKRELGKAWVNTFSDPIFPLPFAAEKRYFSDNKNKRDIQVLFSANLKNNLLRHSIYQRLKAKHNDQIHYETTGERAYREKNCTGNPMSTPVYSGLLSRARVGVNVAGIGYDCARYWEIIAAGAMLFTQALDIQIPDPFINNINCIEFNSLEQFDLILDLILSNQIDVDEIAFRGVEHLLAFHTSTARARYFLERSLESVNLKTCCSGVYGEQVNSGFLKNRLKEIIR